ncbi:unnamed protein product [Closterium sp. NIES-65]|nr:unnamed protein product [Closterium sp. NIES-65]
MNHPVDVSYPVGSDGLGQDLRAPHSLAPNSLFPVAFTSPPPFPNPSATAPLSPAILLPLPHSPFPSHPSLLPFLSSPRPPPSPSCPLLSPPPPRKPPPQLQGVISAPVLGLRIRIIRRLCRLPFSLSHLLPHPPIPHFSPPPLPSPSYEEFYLHQFFGLDYEEFYLHQIFGLEYARYAASVMSGIPFVS